jgi:microcystin-dependent protein
MSRDRIIQVYRGTTAQNDAFTGAAGEITMDTTRKELRVHDGSTAGGNLVGLKPGFVCPFAGTTAPDGWLICDGSAVSRTTYADLFAVIGTTYGAGDGNSTFNLPDTRHRVLWSAGQWNVGDHYDEGLPNITATFGVNGSWSTNSGCVTQSSSGKESHGWNGSSTTRNLFDFNASRSSSIYGASSTVRPRCIVVEMIIKY